MFLLSCVPQRKGVCMILWRNMYDFCEKKCIRMFGRKFYYKTFSPACLRTYTFSSSPWMYALLKNIMIVLWRRFCFLVYFYVQTYFAFSWGKNCVFKKEKANRKTFLFPVSIKMNVYIRKVLRSQLMLLFSQAQQPKVRVFKRLYSNNNFSYSPLNK